MSYKMFKSCGISSQIKIENIWELDWFGLLQAMAQRLGCSLRLRISKSESCSVMSNSLRSHGLCSTWNSLGQKTGVGSLSLLQGIFPTQGWNPGLPHCRQILYQLSHKGSPKIIKANTLSTTSSICTLQRVLHNNIWEMTMGVFVFCIWEILSGETEPLLHC